MMEVQIWELKILVDDDDGGGAVDDDDPKNTMVSEG